VARSLQGADDARKEDDCGLVSRSGGPSRSSEPSARGLPSTACGCREQYDTADPPGFLW